MDESPKELSFKPLTSGLGFHPFSDGLPYAPVTKTPLTGTGAVAAGPAMPAKSAPRIVSPSSPSAAAVEKPQSIFQVETTVPPRTRELHEGLRSDPGIGYLARRAFAYILDTGVNGTLGIAGLYSILAIQKIDSDVVLSGGFLMVMSLFILMLNWALIAAQEVAFGTTLAKHAFGLSLRGNPWRILLRSTLFILSLGLCGLGLVWALFDSERRCWHDRVTGLQPENTTPPL